MTFSIDNPEGGCNNPPLGKYVWEKPSGEQGFCPTNFEKNTNLSDTVSLWYESWC